MRLPWKKIWREWEGWWRGTGGRAEWDEQKKEIQSLVNKAVKAELDKQNRG